MIRRPPRSTPLSLHDALPISLQEEQKDNSPLIANGLQSARMAPIWKKEGSRYQVKKMTFLHSRGADYSDRKSTRLNSSHANISYAVFCLKKNQTVLAHFDRSS